MSQQEIILREVPCLEIPIEDGFSESEREVMELILTRKVNIGIRMRMNAIAADLARTLNSPEDRRSNIDRMDKLEEISKIMDEKTREQDMRTAARLGIDEEKFRKLAEYVYSKDTYF